MVVRVWQREMREEEVYNEYRPELMVK